MKLRIRAVESKDTIRIEIPDDSSLQHLKHSIAQAIRFPSPSSLHLSLNRSDELSSSSPENDSLILLGIASGDLIFYSIVSDGASVSSNSDQVSMPTQVITEPTRNSGSGESKEQERNDLDEESMEIDDESWRFPESCFVKRLIGVLSEDCGGNDVDHKLIVSAVHCVFLESGFVGSSDDKLQFPTPLGFTMSLRYTLPEIVKANQDHDSGNSLLDKSVVLKFQIMKNFVTVYGSLVNADSTYRICVNGHKFPPWISANNSEDYDAEKELFELWWVAKDRLALPLMIDLCARAGLPSPPCFARLPSDLQLKILELLPGTDVAKAGCACKELHYLSRNNELWKQKVREEFGARAVELQGGSAVHWRSVFKEFWKDKMRVEEDMKVVWRMMTRRRRRRLPSYGPPPLLGPVNPFGVPRIGGDHDDLTGFVVPPPVWWLSGRRRGGRVQRFRSPNCNLGGEGGF